MTLKHPVPDKLLKHIGDITVSFALVTTAVQMLAGSLIHEHQRIGQIITAELAFRNLRSLLISLYLERHGEDDDYETLKELLGRARDLEEKRNQIVHSVWATGAEPESITRIKTTAKVKSGLRFRFENMDEVELSSIAEELKQLAYDIQKFWMHLMDSQKAINNPTAPLW